MKIKQRLRQVYRALYDRFGPQYWWPGKTKTEIIVGAILTQNTNWENVRRAIANLRRERLLTFSALRDAEMEVLAELIRPSGYFNMKARRLKNFVDFFYQEYHGSWRAVQADPLSSQRERLLSVNGVGPETADSILLYALGKPVFVIDAFTKRVLSRHGLIRADEEYHTVQALFTEHLPSDTQLFNEYHALFVRVAKEFCGTRPRCEGCPLAAWKRVTI